MSEKFVIAIDGPSGSGKSTIARLLADKLGIRYLDTGAIYRAVAFILDEWKVKPENGPELDEALKKISVDLSDSSVLVNGIDISDKIRNPRVSALASAFSALPAVRESLLDIQRSQSTHCSIVAEGRDMGTVVFPDARVKIFLTADDEIRAERRCKELKEKGNCVDKCEILAQIRLRDKNDSNRNIAPLLKAEDAFLLDTSDIDIEEVVSRILVLVRDRVPSTLS